MKRYKVLFLLVVIAGTILLCRSIDFGPLLGGMLSSLVSWLHDLLTSSNSPLNALLAAAPSLLQRLPQNSPLLEVVAAMALAGGLFFLAHLAFAHGRQNTSRPQGQRPHSIEEDEGSGGTVSAGVPLPGPQAGPRDEHRARSIPEDVSVGGRRSVLQAAGDGWSGFSAAPFRSAAEAEQRRLAPAREDSDSLHYFTRGLGGIERIHQNGDLPGTWTGGSVASNHGRALALTGLSQGGAHQQPYGIFILAHSLGHSTGDHEAAVEAIARQVLLVVAGDPMSAPERIAEVLQLAVMRAKCDLNVPHAGLNVSPPLALTAIVSAGDLVHVVDAGNNLVYLYQPRAGLRQLTTDVSIISSLLSAGRRQPKVLYVPPRHKASPEYAGASPDNLEVSALQLAIQPIDLLLLCSAELWETMHRPQTEAMLREETDPKRLVKWLVQPTTPGVRAGNADVVIVRIPHGGIPEFVLPSARADMPHDR